MSYGGPQHVGVLIAELEGRGSDKDIYTVLVSNTLEQKVGKVMENVDDYGPGDVDGMGTTVITKF